MQIYLPDDAAPLLERRAAAAGFAGQIDAYIVHLITLDEIEDSGAPADLSIADKSSEEIEAMITSGMESGPATPMTSENWQQLRDRVDQRS